MNLNPADIDAWLETCKPEEATLLAARAALRVLPMLATDGREEMPADLLLPVFRAVSASWVGGTWAIQNANLSEAAKTAISAAAIAETTDVSASIILSTGASLEAPNTGPFTAAVTAPVVATTAAAVTALTTTDKAGIKNAFKYAADRVESAITGGDPDVFALATATDKDALDKGATVQELSAMPLWTEGDMPGAMVTLWDRLESRLPKVENWDVWTEWYDARLRGTRAYMKLESDRALIPDGDWKQGPAYGNTIIKSLMEEVGRTSGVKELRNPGDLKDWIENNPELAASHTHYAMVHHLVEWFYYFYENPANETPYDSEEGRYVYINGGPYDALEEIDYNFGGLVSQEVIRLAVDEVQKNGFEWAPSHNHPDYIAKANEDMAEQAAQEAMAEQEAMVERRTRALAEADFRYDPDRNAMEMVPFEEDIASLDSETDRKHFSDELEDIGTACKGLADDIESDQRQVPPSFRQDLIRYSEEAARGPDDVRPGTLRRLGGALVRGAADEDLRYGLGNNLYPKLNNISVRHLKLQARFHGGMFSRIEPLSEATLTESHQVAEARIGEATETIDSDAWGDLPEVPDGFIKSIKAWLVQLRNIVTGIDMVKGEAAIRAATEGFITLAATIIRLGIRTLEAIGENKAITGALALASIIGLLLPLIG